MVRPGGPGRVQAPPDAAGGPDLGQGVRQGSSDAHHQPLPARVRAGPAAPTSARRGGAGRCLTSRSTRRPTVPGGRRPPRPPSAPPATPLPLDATAALVGEYRWIEHALYGLLGEWVDRHAHRRRAGPPRRPEHAPRLARRAVGRAPAGPGRGRPRRADRARRRRPPPLFAALSGTAPPTEGPGSAWPPAGEAVRPPGALPRLAGLYRVVLPRLVTTYERHLRVVSPVTDGPVARALRLVLNDEIEDWQAGERLVRAPGDAGPTTSPPSTASSSASSRWWSGPGRRSGLVAVPGPVPGD